MYSRRNAKLVGIGGVKIGGDMPITIESMTNTKTVDVCATVAQIKALKEAGCDMVRVTVNDAAAADGFAQIRRAVPDYPLIADIHFDYKMAIAAIEVGANNIRINPGNIGSDERVKAVVDAAKKSGCSIRIGVNSGSLEQDLIDKYNGVTAQGLAESALNTVKLVESMEFDDIIVSLKSSNVPMTIEAHEIFAPMTDYPIHIGITEAGTQYAGTIKSVAGLSPLLTRGIGDTLRISLTADPVEEVKAAKELLQSLGIRHFKPEIISCPTCGRTEVNLAKIANEIESRIAHIKTPLKVAVMGCVVNGPGEAKEADIGVACGKGSGMLFKKGVQMYKMDEAKIVDALIKEIKEMVKS